MTAILIWVIAAATIALVLLRPKGWPEAVWACLGAFAMVALRLIPLRAAGVSIARGTDVYLFLTGMMLLSDLARREGVFDWMAGLAVRQARGSPARLFAWVYAVGILVTIFLSNDATAVVLTPAVYAAVKRAKVQARPYLFACAFIANAASFVLPISNPANLVVYGAQLPPLLDWARVFAWPSVLSIAVTFLVLRWRSARDLSGPVAQDEERPKLSEAGRRAAWGIAATAVILISASALGKTLGLPTCLAAMAALLAATRADLRWSFSVVREVPWNVIPLVAGLFVLVEGINSTGAGASIGTVLQALAGGPHWSAVLAASFGAAAFSNVMNNLPAALLARDALLAAPELRHAVMIGIDLGPNLSITGSLATILWLIALRREGEHVNGWDFIKVGAWVMTPALLAATLVLR